IVTLVETATLVRVGLLIVAQEREAIATPLVIIDDEAAELSAWRAEMVETFDNLAPRVSLPPIPPAIDRDEIIPANLDFHAETPSIFDGDGFELNLPGMRLSRRADDIVDPAAPLIPDPAADLPALDIDDLVDIDLD